MQVFNGNTDTTTVVKNTIDPPLIGRRIRLYSVDYNDRKGVRDYNCLKWELYGYKQQCDI